jgi:PAS domain S-box-containing protein
MRLRSFWNLLLLIGPVFGWIVFSLAEASEERRARAGFEEEYLDLAHLLESELAALSETLHATRAFYDGSQEVTRREFQAFARTTLARNPALQALGWAPFVPHAEREEHEAAARREGLPDYRIRALTGHEDSESPSSPSDAIPVLYLEPMAGNEAAIGLDLLSEDTRRRAVIRAIRTDALALSDSLRLAQGGGATSGGLACLTVRRRIGPGPGGAHADLEGLAVLVFRVDALLSGLRRSHPGDVHLRLLHEHADGSIECLAADAACRCAASTLADGRTKRIRLGGNVWTLDGHPSAGFRARNATNQPLYLGLGAAGLGAALVVLVLLGVRYSKSRALLRQDHIFRSVYHSLGEGVIVAGRDGRGVLLNRAAEKLIGLGSREQAPEEWGSVYGRAPRNGQPPSPSDRLPLARAIRGEEFSDAEVHVRDADRGDDLRISVSGAPLRDENDAIQGGVVVLRDITSHRASDETFRRLSNAVAQTADSVFITDREGRIEYVNPAFETLMGYPADEVLGKTPRILKSGLHEPSYYEDLWARISSGEVHRNASVNRCKDGRHVHVEQTITPMKDGAGRITHFVSVCKDMTERRLIQAQKVEMRLVAEVQRRLYPQEAPRIPGLDLAGTVISEDATCGDYFDYLEFSSDRVGIVVGDVSGHGLMAGFIMASTRASLRALSSEAGDLGSMLTRVSGFLGVDLEDHQFVTMLIATIDRTRLSLEFVNAGHPPGFVLDSGGAVKAELGRTGLPLGLRAGDLYATGLEVALEHGDVVVLYSDGITETRDPEGELFETERLLSVIRRHLDRPAKEIVKLVLDEVRGFARGRETDDDMSLVIGRITDRRRSVKLFLYDAGMIHAKTLVVDQNLAMVGTANLDNRSFRLNFEVAVQMYDRGLNDQLARRFVEDLARSTEVTDAAQRGLPARLIEGVARLFSPVL